MFDFLKKKVVAPDDVLVAPIKGMAVPSSSINDPTFGQEMLGKGMAIEPSEGKLYSPIEGFKYKIHNKRWKHYIKAFQKVE